MSPRRRSTRSKKPGQAAADDPEYQKSLNPREFKNMPTKTFGDLPDELLGLIFEHIIFNQSRATRIQSLLNLCQCCSLWAPIQGHSTRILSCGSIWYMVLLLSATPNVEAIVSRDHSPFAKSIAVWLEPMLAAADGTPFLSIPSPAWTACTSLLGMKPRYPSYYLSKDIWAFEIFDSIIRAYLNYKNYQRLDLLVQI